MKIVPQQAYQHKTAGPYSPVLVIDVKKIIVISGQAAIDVQGNVVGSTLAEQARYTLDNCKKALAFAGCDFSHVFKVNIYLTDLANWSEFNEIYRQYFPQPLPVRTAVQAGLLPGLLVEIELWAAED